MDTIWSNVRINQRPELLWNHRRRKKCRKCKYNNWSVTRWWL